MYWKGKRNFIEHGTGFCICIILDLRPSMNEGMNSSPQCEQKR